MTYPLAGPVRPMPGIARHPTQSGIAVSGDGTRLAYDIYGSGETTVVLMPSAPIVHSRQWKGQIHYLSRHFRVVTYDGRGNGRSDRPIVAEAYHSDRIVDDHEAILEATR
jgi:pimeloyl-ACP methyl ester carboxylesterase